MKQMKPLTIPQITVEIVGLRLAFGALVGHLLVDDAADANTALNELIVRINRMAAWSTRPETDAEAHAALAEAARIVAVALIDNLRPGPVGRQ